MKFQLRGYQKEASDAAVKAFHSPNKTNGILICPTGCHAKGSKVIMADGTFKAVEDIKVGDFLLGDDGSPREVLELHTGVDKMFEITPIKGSPFIVNGGHILSLYKTRDGNKNAKSAPCIDEISVNDYLNTNKTYKHLHKLHRPPFIEFQRNEELSLSPYFLGLYLGDGSTANGTVNITTMREEVKDFLYSFTDGIGMHVTENWKGGSNKATTYNLVDRRKHRNVLQNALEELGLLRVTCAFKFIPHKYKVASKENRLQLLAGLLDTDAWYSKEKNTFEYCSKSKRLSDDIIFLCRSLGLYAMIGAPKIVNGETYYRVQISGELDTIPTKVAIRRGKPRAQKKSVLVTGFSVKYVGQGDYYGFTIDGNHLYCDEQFFVHHNSGKSLIIADIASRLDSPLLVFQPSKEILQQNFAKLQSYGILDCGCYSASVGCKDINRITFATIGSVMNHMNDFKHFKYVLIDEAHVVNSKGGMYEKFINSQDRQVIGLTATPYRLSSYMGGSMLKFLTRTRPRIFNEVLYVCQTSDLLAKGYLANLKYYDLTAINIENVRSNSTGADYDEKSLKLEYERSGFFDKLTTTTLRVLNPKNGVPRKGVLVFTRFVEEAENLVLKLKRKGISAAIVTGTTPKVEREKLLNDFKSGEIKVVANVGVLVVGFDFPALDTVILARPTKSLAWYYQAVGRCIRPFDGKDGWIIDLAGNYKRFGKVSDLKIDVEKPNSQLWCVKSNGKILTNRMF